jgi:predicted dehydrogenase
MKAGELIRDRQMGDIMHLRARYGHGGRVGYEKEWRADAALSGGGEMLDQGIHLIDLTRYFAGDVSLAFAELRKDFWSMEVEDNAFFALHSEGGAFAWLHASWTEWKNLFSLEIAMTQAKIEITGLGGSYGIERLVLHRMLPEMGPPMTVAWEWPRGDDSWRLEVEDVLAQIAGEPHTGSTIDDGIAALAIVEEAYRR